MTPKTQLIVALDVDTEEKALGLVEKLKTEVRIFKIGSELFTSCGPGIVTAVKDKGAIREHKGDIRGDRGCAVFLDLKFHDIPNTVAKSAVAAVRLGVSMLNVHALGGYDMMKKAAEFVAAEAKALKITKPKIIAVTALTSMDENGLKKVGIDDSMEHQVLRLAKLAKDASLDGVVASPSEVKLIREELGEDFIIVTPGVRPEWAAVNDQKRIATPKEAVLNGTTYIVVGRPITEALAPLEAARRIQKEMYPPSEVG